MADKEVRIKISIDSDTKELVVTERDVKKLGSAIGSANDQTGLLGGSMKKLIGLAGGLFGLKTTFDNLVKSGIDYNASIQKTLQTLTIIEGSSQKAASSLEWVEEFAIKTPYMFEEVKDAFVKLRAYGIDPADGSLESLGDTAAAMGKPIMQSVEAMADAMVGENERLKEFGIRASVAGDQVEYSWTDSSGRTRSAVVENNSAIIKSTLEAIFNEKYAGAMDAQAKAWEGVTSNTEAAWNKLAGEVTKPLFEGLIPRLASMTDWFNESAQSVHNFMLQFRNVNNLDQIGDLKLKMDQLVEERAKLKEAFIYDASGTVINPNRDAWAEVNQQLRQTKAKILELTEAQKEKVEVVHAEKASLEEISGTLDGHIGKSSNLLEIWPGINQSAKEYMASIEAGGRLMDEIWLSKADEYDKKVYAIAQRWTGLLQNVDDRQLLEAAATAIQSELATMTQEHLEMQIEAEVDFWNDDTRTGIDGSVKYFGDTLNSSISNSVVDALQSGDVLGAVQGLASSVSSSMIQASTSNLLSGSLSGSDVFSIDGFGGVAAGVGMSVVTSFISSLGSNENNVERLLGKIENELQKQTRALEAQIALNTAFGKTGIATEAEFEKARTTYLAEINKMFAGVGISRVGGSFDETDLVTLLTGNTDWGYYERLGLSREAAIESATVYIDEYATALADLTSGFKSYADDLNDIYDQITGTDLLGELKLSAAQKTVADVIGDADVTTTIADVTRAFYDFGVQTDVLGESWNSLSTVDKIETLQEMGTSYDTLITLSNGYQLSLLQALDIYDELIVVGQDVADTMTDVTDSLQGAYDVNTDYMLSLLTDSTHSYDPSIFQPANVVLSAPKSPAIKVEYDEEMKQMMFDTSKSSQMLYQKFGPLFTQNKTLRTTVVAP